MTSVGRASDAHVAYAFVDSVRAEMPDADHHAWAFVAGPPGSTARVGMSDAGEPHGTAGRPMLTALLHGGVGEIVAVCSRWFGGVKLGTGGLARAYAEAVNLALASLPTVELVERARLVVRVGYGDVDGVKCVTQQLGAAMEAEEYGASVLFTLAVPARDAERFRAALAELTQGRASVEGGPCRSGRRDG